ncbi:MAG: TIGR02452 family protein [Synergistaceae bacterium]|nr:TIGR02452 family protein [Synergistaceae bacterium]
MPEKSQLVDIFTDTQHFYGTNEILREAIEFSVSNTKFYPSDFSIETESHKAGEIRLIKGRTVKTALNIAREFPDKKIAVLNFASSTEPGGGVLAGHKAQEESICRSTTLYPSINTDEMKLAYYVPHRDDYVFTGWDECIYSPGVIICRNDSDNLPQRLKPDDFAKIDVITCAAPHIRDEIIKAQDLLSLHIKRAESILRICAFNGADIFIGGAFGCGTFGNDPYIVAWAWREALKNYREKFSLTVFAVHSKQWKDGDNYKAFRNEFPEYVFEVPEEKQEQEAEEITEPEETEIETETEDMDDTDMLI